MKFEGIITKELPEASGTGSTGKEWRRKDYVLEYEAHEKYPKAIVFSVMGDNIEKLALCQGGTYEVDIDFSVREYNGKFYQSATAWRAERKDAPVAEDNSMEAPPF